MENIVIGIIFLLILSLGIIYVKNYQSEPSFNKWRIYAIIASSFIGAIYLLGIELFKFISEILK